MCINNTAVHALTHLSLLSFSGLRRQAPFPYETKMDLTILLFGNILLNVILKDKIIKFTFIKFEGEM